ncbi:hypothetical protein BpHYR1_043011 [Brachionus plicatilis]|uniref:Uncharacterized protein n=1 Tax=Brachionus plicatilis TaxID=10195 RepID=A0A3M7QLZ7_BRAPC|nr:hypothetical protein BpHYR1_043011 [Brachionus plicatilis]
MKSGASNRNGNLSCQNRSKINKCAASPFLISFFPLLLMINNFFSKYIKHYSKNWKKLIFHHLSLFFVEKIGE